MVGMAITNALESNLFDEVIVTTDSDEIAKISQDYGAKIPKLRSKNLSDDFATTYDVVADVLTKDWIGDNMPDYACCIYATTPLLKVEHLKLAYEKLIGGNFSYVFPAIQYSHPIQRSFRVGDDGKLRMLYPEHLMSRSQDLEATLHDAGQFYWGTSDAWLKKEPIFGSNSSIIQSKSNTFVDIDNWDDLRLAEILLKLENH